MPPEAQQPLAMLVATLAAAGLLALLHPRARRAAAVVAVSGTALSMNSCGPVATFAWVHTDTLGTPLAVTDSPATGNPIKVIWRASYEPFGKATVNQDPDGDNQQYQLNVRFPGQYADSETGLHYNFYRTYDPATGRYLESDRIGQVGGLNVFEYAASNPTNRIDPYGLWAWPWKIKSRAADEATDRFPGAGARGGDQDAYRHCLGACWSKQENTEIVARVLGWANEVMGDVTEDQEIGERRMDEFNNECGFSKAEGATSAEDCRERCLAATLGNEMARYMLGSTAKYSSSSVTLRLTAPRWVISR